MEIHPRYDVDPAIVVDCSIEEIAVPFLRQRRRLAALLHELSAVEWAAPSRCEGWSTQDVVGHVVSTDGFWGVSLESALDGAPTKLLVGFDPKATPAQIAAGAGPVDRGDLLARHAGGVDALCRAVESLTDDQWDLAAEAPPGHVSVRTMLHHALWDTWIHERDVVLPLGRAAVEEPDEIAACLRYVACLSPAFGQYTDPARTGSLVLDATDPQVRLVVEVGRSVSVRSVGSAAPDALELHGDAVELVEQLSVRMPFDHTIPTEHRWMVSSLAEVFETEPLRQEHG
ncbi:MAG TPA: maleylpyruvate isomerase family mycothiol-dependent enzyme [Acidimicrobiales bacterium]|nr:maleylpyruvate isomerase family mycothiol-dependent enzyme [Acidimicrobiales bacterium]